MAEDQRGLRIETVEQLVQAGTHTLYRTAVASTGSDRGADQIVEMGATRIVQTQGPCERVENLS